MARHYWEATYKFQAQADVPFEYICGKCGKTVSGKRLIALTYTYRKTAGKQGDLGLTDVERRSGQGKAQEVVEKELRLYRTQVQKGIYDFIDAYKECPHCQSKQKWAYSSKRGWLEAMFGPFVTVFGIFMFIQLSRKGFYAGDEGALYAIMGVICSMLGVGFTYAGIDELRKRKALRGQKDKMPVLHFPE